eukprot:Colp12_sorted_trinity150504_noHs@7836
MASRLLGQLKAERTAFLLCDMQEIFRKPIQNFAEIVEQQKKLLQAANIFKIPVLGTEQVPAKLGATIKDLDITGVKMFAKTKFSMLEPEVMNELKSTKAESIVLFGIEAHVCVQQTALELLEHGYDVHLVADAVSSRTQTDRLLAIERMRQSGAFVTSTESVLFALLGDAKSPHFKAVSSLVRPPAPDTGLFNAPHQRML